MAATFDHIKGLALSFLGAMAVTAAIMQTPAEAAQCGPRDAVLAHIAGEIKAHRQAMALAGQANMVEVFVAENGAWIITVTSPSKATCVLAAG